MGLKEKSSLYALCRSAFICFDVRTCCRTTVVTGRGLQTPYFRWLVPNCDTTDGVLVRLDIYGTLSLQRVPLTGVGYHSNHCCI